MVADLTSVDNPEVAPQRIAVPPRDPLASTSREPSPGPPQPPGSPLGKSFPGMSEHAQKILDRLAGAAAQYNGTNGNGANASAGLLDPRTSPALGKNSGLALMEDRLRQQALELRQAKLQLA